MTSVLNIEGKEYTQATGAAKDFGYTKDYLLLLIKNGKIEGKKVGNKWYVFVPSVQAFFDHAKTRKEERRNQIREERKKELSSHARVRFAGNRQTALLETIGVLVIGLALGVTGYVGTTAQQTAYVGEGAVNFFEQFAISLYTKFGSPAENVTIGANDSDVSGEVMPVSHEGLIVLPQGTTDAEMREIEAQFSDPVTVVGDDENPNAGVITPEFRDGTGESYRFLMVPMETETQ